MNTETARDNITISGKTFSVPAPYTDGHVLSASEATALNRTLADTFRSKFAKKVEIASKNGTFDADLLQSQIDDFADNFEFGQPSAGRSAGDPVMAEAMEIARDKIRKAILKKGGKLKGQNKAITARAVLLFQRTTDADKAKADEIIALAKANVAAMQNVADEGLDV